MPRLLLLAIIAAMPFPATARAGSAAGCADLMRLIQTTYTFKPSKLSRAEQATAAANMDKVWKLVKSDPANLAPCLRAAIEDPHADPWFRFDGSNLLMTVDPSPDSKAVQARAYLGADLADVEPEVWVETLAQRGWEGFDVSEAGARWLANPKMKYYIAAHGGFPVDAIAGALFLFGSMEEPLSRDALVKIANQLDHPGREAAVRILCTHTTRESFLAMKQLNVAGLSQRASERLKRRLENPELVVPAANPTLSKKNNPNPSGVPSPMARESTCCSK